ncbi:hypothetical protein ACFC8F_03360 [Streptomyces hydrogenans]|uniref:hypothetical protein n=1 Tax=Streptomyces hydrogenans TaxID=1873719 RepID=UPI0035DD9BAE
MEDGVPAGGVAEDGVPVGGVVEDEAPAGVAEDGFPFVDFPFGDFAAEGSAEGETEGFSVGFLR